MIEKSRQKEKKRKKIVNKEKKEVYNGGMKVEVTSYWIERKFHVKHRRNGNGESSLTQ